MTKIGRNKTSPTGPLTIYVAWHPDCPDGAFLAKAVYDWFRKPSTAVERSGAGIPVYYRCRPMSSAFTTPIQSFGALEGDSSPASEDVSPHRPIQFEHAEINVVIPLIDEHLVNDVSWRRWLYDVGELHRQSLPQVGKEGPTTRSVNEGQVLMVPVQLHSSISRLAPVVSSINAVRVDRWDDDDRGIEPEQASFRRRIRRARRIRRFLVQTLVRELRLRRDAFRADLLPRSVFLSHAKGDRESGVGVAEKIRAEALNQGQIDTFFDTTDLDWGAHWQGPMESAAGERTAAFIAIFGDLYASRFWCREEIRRARHPRKIGDVKHSRDEYRDADPDKKRAKESEGNSSEHAELASRRDAWALDRIWWVQPTVIVDTLGQGWSRLLPEMSGSPIIRWRDDRGVIAEILDRVMLEALRAEIQARHAILLSRGTGRYYEPRADDAHRAEEQALEVHFLTWVPDPYTLMELAYPARRPRRTEGRSSKDEAHPEAESSPFGDPFDSSSRKKSLVIYPGHGLAQSDELRLKNYWGDSVQFMSVEELAMEFRNPDHRGQSSPSKGAGPFQLSQAPLVALSVGDPELEELSALGYGPEHLDDAVYRLATALIDARARLSYGGALLRTKTSEFLVSVLDAAGMMYSEPEHHEELQHPEAEPDTFVHSYQAWDYYQKTRTDTRADLHGLCTFHDVRAKGLPSERVQEMAEPEKALWRARSLSAMRRVIAKDCRAMVALGGKPYGWKGFAPGVLEEICRMHDEDKPVLVLSCFGGAARRIVSWFQKPNDSTLDWLYLDHHLDHPKNHHLRVVQSALVDDLGEEEARRHLEQRYQFLRETLADLKSRLLEALEGRSSYAGLNSDELERLMTTSSVSQIRHLLTQRVVPDLYPSA